MSRPPWHVLSFAINVVIVLAVIALALKIKTQHSNKPSNISDNKAVSTLPHAPSTTSDNSDAPPLTYPPTTDDGDGVSNKLDTCEVAKENLKILFPVYRDGEMNCEPVGGMWARIVQNNMIRYALLPKSADDAADANGSLLHITCGTTCSLELEVASTENLQVRTDYVYFLTTQIVISGKEKTMRGVWKLFAASGRADFATTMPVDEVCNLSRADKLTISGFFDDVGGIPFSVEFDPTGIDLNRLKSDIHCNPDNKNPTNNAIMHRAKHIPISLEIVLNDGSPLAPNFIQQFKQLAEHDFTVVSSSSSEMSIWLTVLKGPDKSKQLIILSALTLTADKDNKGLIRHADLCTVVNNDFKPCFAKIMGTYLFPMLQIHDSKHH